MIVAQQPKNKAKNRPTLFEQACRSLSGLGVLALATLALNACQKGGPGADAQTEAAKAATSKPAAVRAKPAQPARPTSLPAPSDVAAAPKDAQTTASGLASRVLKPATGTAKPAATDTVRVHYTGWTTDGKMFDSSEVRGRPASFPLNRVIKGWTEGLQLMAIGEKRRFWIPGKLAYGDTPARPGAPAGTLVFDVELLDIPSQKQPAKTK